VSKRTFVRGRKAALRTCLLISGSLSVLLLLGAPQVDATTFSYDSFGWSTDRANTASVAVENGDFGRDDVLHLGIADYTPPNYDTSGYQGFLQTEGYQALTGLPVGSAFISGDLYIPTNAATSSTAFYQSIGLWGVISSSGTVDNWPIIQFYNGPNPSVQPTTPGSGTSGQNVGEIRGADNGITDPTLSEWATLTGPDADSTFASDPSAAINYGAWNTFRINYIAGSIVGGGSYQLLINGVVVATMSGYPFQGVDPSDTSLSGIILDSRTNGSNPYDVFWSNIVASLDEQYYNVASLGPAAVVGGEMILGTYTDRRGLDWDSNKYAWAHVVGGVAKFDDGAGTLTSNVAGAQYGQDLFALGEPSTRIGFTFGYTTQSDSLRIPAGTSASSNSQEPSIGGYITHADQNFYADLLGQYRFLNFDATSPTSEGKVTGGSIDVAAEAGMHWKLGDGVTLTPMGQLLYEHVNLDEANVGSGLDATFTHTDALIARGRMLLQSKVGGFSVFGSAGVAGNLLGPMTTTVTGNAFQTNIGGVQAEFVGGIDAAVSAALDVFGSGEFDTSFDGKSQSYAGRAGFRANF